MTGYDFDGVCSTGRYKPKPGDIVVTGRVCCPENLKLIQSVVGADVPIYMQPCCIEANNRTYAGRWKGMVCALGRVETFYEDDPVQAELIRQFSPSTTVVMVN